jgi:macrolide-specific efflux system membrane fusion protein
MTQLATDTAHAVNQTALSRRERRRPLHARRWPMVAVLLVVGAVGAFIATRGSAHSYVVGSARRGTVSETVAVSGALQPTRSWNLYFSTSGTVATVFVSAGQHVNQGQVLATLNTDPLRAQVSSAQAAITASEAKLSADQAKLSAGQAKLDADQAKQDAHPANTPEQSAADSALITSDQNALTADQGALTADEDAHTAAEQQLATAQANLAAATLRAPAATTVAQVNVAAGQNIGGGGGGGGGGAAQAGSASASASNQASTSGSTTSATTGGSNAAIILENGSLQALGQVSDSQIAQVHRGQQALVTPAGQTTAINGRVEAITPLPTSSGGVITYPVEIGWGGHRKDVFDGMSAQISIVVAKTSGLTVPSSAVHTSGTQSWVTVVHGAGSGNGRARGGQATRQVIDVGPSGGGLTIVRSGLQAGDQVVLADNSAPLPSSSSSLQKGSGKGSQVRKLLG